MSSCRVLSMGFCLYTLFVVLSANLVVSSYLHPLPLYMNTVVFVSGFLPNAL